MKDHNATPINSDADKMKKIKYFLIAFLLCLGAIVTLYFLLHSTDFETVLIAAKLILLPAFLFLISLVLFLLSIYFLQAGRKAGKPRQHVRFL